MNITVSCMGAYVDGHNSKIKGEGLENSAWKEGVAKVSREKRIQFEHMHFAILIMASACMHLL